jgi:phosphoglycerate dehydrogenase-like enzyme
MNKSFRVGVTRDFLKPDGSLGFGDIGLASLEQRPDIHWEFLPDHYAELPRDVADHYDALLVLAPRVTRQTVAETQRLGLVARFGVGYDSVDVPSCTESGVLLTITPGGVRRPVATSALAFLLALSHRLLAKDRLTRTGRWVERLEFNGVGLTGRTLGVIGLGNIGREIFKLAQPLEMKHAGHDPYLTREAARVLGIEWLPLEDLLGTADFVVVACALNDQTRGLLSAERLALLKPTAFVINVARGPIIDQAALTHMLQRRKIAGAALDVFEQEPISPDDPLLALDNVILAPHSICWTDEMFLGNGRQACQSILDYSVGRVPENVVNRAALENPAFQAKLARLARP